MVDAASSAGATVAARARARSSRTTMATRAPSARSSMRVSVNRYAPNQSPPSAHHAHRSASAPATNDDQTEHEGAEIEGKDAQHPAGVERDVVARLVLAGEENAGDQEPRQHEEQIHADPAEIRNALQCVADVARVRPLELRLHGEVVGDDEKDGDAAKAVERRDVGDGRSRLVGPAPIPSRAPCTVRRTPACPAGRRCTCRSSRTWRTWRRS